jgi:hypothetical protein
LLIVGVSDESEDELDKFIKDFGPKFPILLAENAGTKYGVSSYPSGVLFDADQKVTKEGHPGRFTQADYDAALKSVVLWPAGVPTDGALQALKPSFHGKRYAELAQGIQKVLAQTGLADADRQGAEKLKALLGDRCAVASAEVRELASGPDYLASSERLEDLARWFEKLPPGGEAKATLESFKKDERIQKEITAAKKIAAIQGKVDAAKTPNAKKKLAPEVKALAAQLKGTHAGERAAKLLDELQRIEPPR